MVSCSCFAPPVSRILLLLSLVSLIGTASASGRGLPLSTITLPPGFSIDLYAENVPGARSMTLGAKGTLFVGTRSEGKVYAVVDRNNDQRGDEVITIARGLKMPNGVAFRNGSLYVAEVNRVIRYDAIEDRLRNPPRPVDLQMLPDGSLLVSDDKAGAIYRIRSRK